MPVSHSGIRKALTTEGRPRLIQGLAHYVDDIVLPGLLHIAFVRSPYAHAKFVPWTCPRRKPRWEWCRS